MITVRKEQRGDYEEVHELVSKAFATTSYSDGTEADYLWELRTKDTFIPQLSFVAVTGDDTIVGQIVLYKTYIKTEKNMLESLVLSPLSVHPDYFRQGIARLLIERALKQAVAMSYTSVFLCGEPQIYQKLGFRPSYEFGVYHKDNPKAPWCMGRELMPDSLAHIRGTIDIV